MPWTEKYSMNLLKPANCIAEALENRKNKNNTILIFEAKT
jgi:hypothetical protein